MFANPLDVRRKRKCHVWRSSHRPGISLQCIDCELEIITEFRRFRGYRTREGEVLGKQKVPHCPPLPEDLSRCGPVHRPQLAPLPEKTGRRLLKELLEISKMEIVEDENGHIIFQTHDHGIFKALFDDTGFMVNFYHGPAKIMEESK